MMQANLPDGRRPRASHDSSGMLVSVPCSCGAEVGPLDALCRACKAPVSQELHEAIEASLEAAHPEYREANQRVRRSATVLLMVALLYLSFGLLLYVVSAGDEFTPLTEQESRQRIGALVENTLVGFALLGSYFATRRAPLRAFVAALGVWMALQILAFSLAPSTLLLAFLSASGVALLMAKIVVLVLLVRGAVAAHRRNKILRDLA